MDCWYFGKVHEEHPKTNMTLENKLSSGSFRETFALVLFFLHLFFSCFRGHITHKFYSTWSLMHHILRKKIYSICIIFPPWQYIHVLVCPKREVKRFADLSSDETCDLWVTAKEVGVRLEQYHKASSLTFAIQVWYMLQFYCCSELILPLLNSPNLFMQYESSVLFGCLKCENDEHCGEYHIYLYHVMCSFTNRTFD